MKDTVRRIFLATALLVGLTLPLAGFSLASAPVVMADTVSDIRDGVTGSGGSGSKNQGSRVLEVIRIVVNILLFLIGTFAVIMIVVAGFRFVASNGDANTVSSARNTILYAVVGLVVAFLAYALVNFVIGQLK